jgi:DHA1 family bicyclomycin/chloramphenicol resistance-like MFS transporter
MRTRPLPYAEFVLLITALFSVVAFSTDAMLPAFPQIAHELELSNVNRAGLVVSIFFLGTGVGQLVMGPLSDSIGRKPVMLAGLAIYMLFSWVGYISESLEMLLVARFLQGIGVSAPRTVSMAMIRDLYVGRVMAQIMSLSMVLFVLVPAIAPYTGMFIINAFGWRSIFLSFVIFGFLCILWLGLRQPETHPPEARRPVTLSAYRQAASTFLSSRIAVIYSLVLSICFSCIIGYLSSAQQVYDVVFGRGEHFPFWFAMVALASGPSGFLNAGLVRRFGMRRIVTVAMVAFLAITLSAIAVNVLAAFTADVQFAQFLGWSVSVFWLAGLAVGNLNALVMEPMGAIAGMAAAISGAMSTVVGVALAIPMGLVFDGTVLPLQIGIAMAAAVGIGLMLSDPKGQAVARAG